jgi:hypothetical protein
VRHGTLHSSRGHCSPATRSLSLSCLFTALHNQHGSSRKLRKGQLTVCLRLMGSFADPDVYLVATGE